MDARAVAALFGGLAILFLVYAYASRRSLPRLPPGGLVLTTTEVRAIANVDREERLSCPKRARALLLQVTERGVMYRDAAAWVVATGRDLRITRGGGGGPAIAVHYLRRPAPVVVTDLPRPAGSSIPGFVAYPGGAIDIAALSGADARIERFERQEDAVVAAAAQPRCLMLYNGAQDPSYYVVRPSGGDPAAAIVRGANLPGTVYVRES